MLLFSSNYSSFKTVNMWLIACGIPALLIIFFTTVWPIRVTPPKLIITSLVLLGVAILMKESQFFLSVPRIIRHYGADVFIFPGLIGLAYLRCKISHWYGWASYRPRGLRNLLIAYAIFDPIMFTVIEVVNPHWYGVRSGANDPWDIVAYAIGMGLSLLIIIKMKEADFVLPMRPRKK